MSSIELPNQIPEENEEEEEEGLSLFDVLDYFALNHDKYGCQTVWPQARSGCAPFIQVSPSKAAIREDDRYGSLTYQRKGLENGQELLRGDLIVHQASGVFCLVVQRISRNKIRIEAWNPPIGKRGYEAWEESNQGEGTWITMGQAWKHGEQLPHWLLQLPELVDATNPDLMDLFPNTRANNRRSWQSQGLVNQRDMNPVEYAQAMQRLDMLMKAIERGRGTESDFETPLDSSGDWRIRNIGLDPEEK
jgi:hypothetical protein